jgi:UDP-N-acetylmuramoyl-L-alanyl-D-glutamate--2,6-diaminopimelate ligase
VELQRTLREMAEAGVTHALLEVSSHGLDHHRVEACHFSRTVFTMLGRDHLDHHGSMENYFASKSRLFTEILPGSAVKDPLAIVNRDDPYGRRILDLCPVPTISVGREEDADYCIESASWSRDGTLLRIRTPGGILQAHCRLLGAVNALNVLLATAAADSMGLEADAIVRGIEAVERIPGRLERIASDRGFLVLVDYAHTPDALDRVLSSVRELTPRRLITVFGCGGDRDRGKRPLMGEAAARWSDTIVVTSDNPRSESPESIIGEILPGIRRQGACYREPAAMSPAEEGAKAFTHVVDRRSAIQLAVGIAGDGDTVVVAGKGHEDVQILGDRRVPFRDDKEVTHALHGHGSEESILG